MNRAQRRALTRAAGRSPGGFQGVILEGGPKPTPIVGQNAPCLHPDWWRSYNAAVEHGWAKGPPVAPGRYVLDPHAELRTAVWRTYDEVPAA